MSDYNILADVFKSSETQYILKNKYVLLIGDSVIRGMYKDLVKILQKDDYLLDSQLKNKGEFHFEGDNLLEGGQKGNLNNDVTYTEVREFKTPYNLVRFYFVTRCYSDYLKSICEDIKQETDFKPDLVIMNSGCWDLTRYGVNSIYEYKKNLPLGIYSLIKVLPNYTLFLWTTTLPLSKDVKGGFMVPEAECHQSKLREDVLEANKYAVNVIEEFRLDLLDLHFYFRNQIQRRAKDGIHWDATAHRRITNLILNHVCDAWDLDPPGRILMKKEVENMKKEINSTNCFDDLERSSRTSDHRQYNNQNKVNYDSTTDKLTVTTFLSSNSNRENNQTVDNAQKIYKQRHSSSSNSWKTEHQTNNQNLNFDNQSLNGQNSGLVANPVNQFGIMNFPNQIPYLNSVQAEAFLQEITRQFLQNKMNNQLPMNNGGFNNQFQNLMSIPTDVNRGQIYNSINNFGNSYNQNNHNNNNLNRGKKRKYD